MSSQHTYFNFMTKILNNPVLRSQKSLAAKFFKYFYLVINLIFVVLVLIQFRFTKDIYDAAFVFNSLATFGHLLLRHCSLVYYADLYHALLEDIYNFWTYDTFGPALAKICRRKMGTGVWMVKSLSVANYTLLVFFNVWPFISESVEIQQICYIPEPREYNRWVIYVFEFISINEIQLTILVCDGFLFCICAELNIQFSLLAKAFRNIKICSESTDKSFAKLKLCVRYHLFILKVYNEMQLIYSGYFLFAFYATIQSTCIHLYAATGTDSLSQIAFSVMFIMTQVFQCAVPIFAVVAVEMAAETVPGAIYNIDWYNTDDARITDMIIFMLMKIQQIPKFSAGGFIDVNNQVLLQILKTGFSIFTLLKNMQ